MNDYSSCKDLILLVGSNPLPNYLSIRILEPERVSMLYTRETETVMKQLKAIFEEQGVKIHQTLAVEATKARSISDGLNRIWTDGAYLNYTGGTKVMAAHALAAFREIDCHADEKACYIDEKAECLIFDSGYQIPLSEKKLGLSVELLGRLHGLEVKLPKPVEGGPTLEDARQILERVIKDDKHTISKCLNECGGKFRDLKQVKKARDNPFTPDSLGLKLSVDRIPGDDWTDDRFEAWYEFLRGGWFENVVADLVKQVSSIEPVQNVKCCLPSKSNSKRDFELDVILIRGHRLYVVSCTSSNRLEQSREKLFEVSLRARQLGGDLARAAVVSLLDGKNENGSCLDQCQQDVESVWDAPNKPRVFGAAHMYEWIGTYGEPNLDSLKEWLNS